MNIFLTDGLLPLLAGQERLPETGSNLQGSLRRYRSQPKTFDLKRFMGGGG
jgi:Sec-independent protein translocase protein TatA